VLLARPKIGWFCGSTAKVLCWSLKAADAEQVWAAGAETVCVVKLPVSMDSRTVVAPLSALGRPFTAAIESRARVG